MVGVRVCRDNLGHRNQETQKNSGTPSHTYQGNRILPPLPAGHPFSGG
jgi:hypothetical protein